MAEIGAAVRSYRPTTKPTEVNNLNVIPYDSDWNNLAPAFGFAYRLAKNLGVVRGAYGTHFGEIFFVTYQQLRFSPPLYNKIVVTAPDLASRVEDMIAGFGAARPDVLDIARVVGRDADAGNPAIERSDRAFDSFAITMSAIRRRSVAPVYSM